MQMNEFSGFARNLAAASGDLLRHYFQAGDIEVETKGDASPVTRADRDTEAMMRDMIMKTFPDHGILGEEYGTHRPDAEFVWTLDPIDGTVSFINDCPLFGTLIGLLHGGAPVLGVIHLPVTGRLCLGDGRETSVNGQAVRVRNPARLADATLLGTDLRALLQDGNERMLGMLTQDTRLFRTWGDCFGYLQVAAGRADIMLDRDMRVWDIMPLVPVIRGAGGMITTWSGDPPQPGESCLACGKALHRQLVGLLGRAGGTA